MKHLLKYILFFLFATTLGSCLKNDIPYPRIQANFLSFEVDGSLKSAEVDSVNKVVTVYLKESTDIKNVRVSAYSITPNSKISGANLMENIDLSKDVYVTLSLFQDYLWTIKGVQNIERYFTVANQVGSSTIDAIGKRVVAAVPDGSDTTAVKIQSIKLGAEGSEMKPDISGKTVDFTNPVTVEITNHGRTEQWTIYVNTTKSTVSTLRVDAWTNVAWVYCEAQEGKENGVEYKKSTDNDWTKAPENWITHNGGSYYARLIHLEPQTAYIARSFSGEDYGAEIEFTTGSSIQVPNLSFDDWWLDGKVWNPWAEGGESFWDTGNKGATTLGNSNSTPTNDTFSGSGKAAMLETKFVGIGVVGKLAAGNIFTGKYVATDGTNGILSFGKEFKERPTKLKGKLKYVCTPISHTSAGFENLKGRPDTAIVWTALFDANEPCTIRTNPKNQQLFNPKDPSVIAYGNVQYGQSVDNYTTFEITLDYNDTQRIPKFIIIVASASKYGDYFTGGNGSILYVDDMELLYDY